MKTKSLMQLLLLILLILPIFALMGSAQNEVDLYFFYGETCPVCAKQEVVLEQLSEEYSNLKIHYYEVYNDEDNLALFQDMAKAYGGEVRGVPGTFIDDSFLAGYHEGTKEILIQEIERCSVESCIDPIDKLDNGNEDQKQINETITVPFVGKVELSKAPIIVSTALISFVDGFNPCSLWVLIFLLGIVIYSGSRKKIFMVGITFLLVTATAYGIFMFSLLNVFLYIGYLRWIQVGVALIALIFALVNIKDYFWFKKGISFTISDKYKPKLFKNARNIMTKQNSIVAMLIATVVMALGITLVELPCTGGFPVIWTNLLIQQNVSYMMYIVLFLLYMLIYLIDELIVFSIAVITLKVSKFEEKHGRMLKLIGGMIMLGLALTLIINPELMESLMGTIYVFGGAVILSIIIMYIHDKMKPKDKTLVKDEHETEKSDLDDKDDIKDNEKENQDGLSANDSIDDINSPNKELNKEKYKEN